MAAEARDVILNFTTAGDDLHIYVEADAHTTPF